MAIDPHQVAETPPLEVRGVSKRFGRVAALSEVSVDFAPAEVHAVLGENGAGKSTLMNLLSGSQQPDGGEIRLAGRPVVLRSPRAARDAGIGMVHQHFTLVDTLTVAENLASSFRRPGEWRYDASLVEARAREFAAEIALPVDIRDVEVGSLPVGTRQRLEILKALAGPVRILILDEPTAVLTPQETEHLLAILGRLRARGRTIIFITHKLAEAKAIADRITVLRGGRVAGTFRADEISETELAACMVGGAPPASAATAAPVNFSAAEVLAIEGLALGADGQRLLDAIDLRLQAGEILAVAGVDGNGQAELFEILAGLRSPTAGTIRVFGKTMSRASAAAALELGIHHIPPDRQHDGLILTMSVVENCVLSSKLLRRFSRRGMLDFAAMRSFAESIRRDFGVSLDSLDAPVRGLSGGNQQKVVVGRELGQQPRVLVAVNPTRGLDIRASGAVAAALRRAAAQGCAVLLVSTDLDEVLALGHSVRVLFRGHLSRALRPPVDRREVGLLMSGATA